MDDYLHQAADPKNRPSGIIYDPDNTGDSIPSLGVHEHWNNATDMQYSGNLDSDSGIYLVKILNGIISDINDHTILNHLLASVYPNPSPGHITIRTELEDSGVLNIDLLDMSGRVVKKLEKSRQVQGTFQRDYSISDLESGSYIYHITLTADKENQHATGKIQLL